MKLAFVGDRRRRDLAARRFEFLALMRATAHPGVQAEPVRSGAQGPVFFVAAGHRSQARHLLFGARPQRDAMGARGESRNEHLSAESAEEKNCAGDPTDMLVHARAPAGLTTILDEHCGQATVIPEWNPGLSR